MAKWDRNAPWRQGHLLSAETIAAFGLAQSQGKDPEQVAAVVISHDCDLAQTPETESQVEIIVGRFVEKVDGNYANCKNLRRLHLECNAGTDLRVLEIEAASRFLLPKDAVNNGEPALADHVPCGKTRMSTTERNTLQHWLAARYRRSAFPDEFDRRLKSETGVAERLSKAFTNSGKHVSAVFFDIDGGEEKVREGPNDPYELRITLLSSTADDPEKSEVEANNAAKKVNEIFQARCRKQEGKSMVWQWIELVSVEVISDEALSYAASQQLKKWQADHISLKENPPQVIFEG